MTAPTDGPSPRPAPLPHLAPPTPPALPPPTPMLALPSPPSPPETYATPVADAVAAAVVPAREDAVDLADLRRRAVGAAGWTAVAKWTNRGSSLVVFAVLGRFLSPGQLGTAALAVTFLSIFQVLSDQGFSDAIVQRPRLRRGHLDSAFAVSVSLSLVLAGAMVGVAVPASRLLHAHELAPVMMISSIGLPLSALSSVPIALLERGFQFRKLAAREVSSNVLGGAVGIVVAVLGGGVWAIVAQNLVLTSTAVIVLWSVERWRPGRRIAMRYVRDLRQVGLGLLGVQILNFVNAQSDKIIIGAFIDPVAVGYYFVGSRIISIVLDLQGSIIAAVSLTTLSRVQHDQVAFRRVFYRFISTSGVLSAFSFAALAATAPLVIPVVFGDQWRSSVGITQVMCLVGVLGSVLAFDREALVAVGRAGLALQITVVQTGVGVLATIAAVPFGPFGVSIGVTARQWATWPFRLRQLTGALHLEMRTYLSRVFAPFLAGLVTAGVMWGVSRALPHATSNVGRLGAAVVIVLVGLVPYVVLGRFLFADVLHDAGRELRRARRRITARRAPA